MINIQLVGAYILLHVPRAASDGVFFCLFCLFWESPPSIWLKAARKPGYNGLVKDLRVRDWLWLRNVLAPLAHPT